MSTLKLLLVFFVALLLDRFEVTNCDILKNFIPSWLTVRHSLSQVKFGLSIAGLPPSACQRLIQTLLTVLLLFDVTFGSVYLRNCALHGELYQCYGSGLSVWFSLFGPFSFRSVLTSHSSTFPGLRLCPIMRQCCVGLVCVKEVLWIVSSAFSNDFSEFEWMTCASYAPSLESFRAHSSIKFLRFLVLHPSRLVFSCFQSYVNLPPIQSLWIWFGSIS
jgi:hypothetical protein